MRYLSQRILLAVSAVELDERLSRSVLLGLGGVVVEGRGDLLGKLLAQLDAPLVVGVDAPDRALDKRDVLVQGDELTKRERGQRVAKIEVVGRLPSKQRAGTICSGVPSARTSSAVLPKASALVWARKLPRNSSCTS